MARVTKGRIEIPKNIEENLQLASKVYEKHQKDGASSILNNIDDMDWNAMGPNIALCLQKHLEAEDLKRKTEEAYRPVTFIFHNSTSYYVQAKDF